MLDRVADARLLVWVKRAHSGRGLAGASAPSPIVAPLVIAAVALALMLPELVAGLAVSDSLRYNIVWGDQFRALFRSGELYPRWLPDSWNGLGSPTFYFYPPLFFWAASLLDLLSFGLLPTERLISATSLLFLIASGMVMRLWLLPLAGARAALVGAIVYMAAPYHLFDILGRGAVAEASGYVFLPLILVALRGLCEGRRGFFPLVAIAYAGLVFSHLPTALLTSVFVIPPYVLFAASRSPLGARIYLAQALTGGLLGLGMAAIYLVPALTLTGHISSQAFFGSFYSVENWFFWRPGAWPRPGPMVLIVPVSLACLLLGAAGAVAARPSDMKGEAFVWFAIGAACFVMISGALPVLWDVPPLAQVQFPWRLLLPAEFAAITALAIGRPRLNSPLTFAGAVPAVLAITFAFTMVIYSAVNAAKLSAATVAEIRLDYPDAPEYLPPGFPIATNEEGAPEPELIGLPSPRKMENGVVTFAHGQSKRSGALTVQVEAGGIMRVEAPLFYFPHWRVLDSRGRGVKASSSERGLLSWEAPRGRSVFQIRPSTVPGERLALAISAASLLALLATGLFLGRRRRERDFSAPSG